MNSIDNELRTEIIQLLVKADLNKDKCVCFDEFKEMVSFVRININFFINLVVMELYYIFLLTS